MKKKKKKLRGGEGDGGGHGLKVTECILAHPFVLKVIMRSSPHLPVHLLMKNAESMQCKSVCNDTRC